MYVHTVYTIGFPHKSLMRTHFEKRTPLIIPYSALFSRGIYFTNFEIAAIHGIIFRENNGKTHPRS